MSHYVANNIAKCTHQSSFYVSPQYLIFENIDLKNPKHFQKEAKRFKSLKLKAKLTKKIKLVWFN